MSPVTRLTPDHPANVVSQSNTANVRSLVLAWEVPNNTIYRVGHEDVNPKVLSKGELLPVIKLFEDGGTEIDGDSLIAFAVRADKQELETHAGFVRYHVFRDLSTAQQRNRDHLQSVLTQLNGRVRLAETARLEVHIESPQVVDLDEAGTTFEVPVIETRP